MNRLRPTIAYITSRPHSGSTLLALLMNAHSKVISVGELKQLLHHQTCTCHGLPPEKCPFWSQVDARVYESVGLHLYELDLIDGDDDAKFLRDNEALYMALALVSGCSIIVDSSKTLRRLKRLRKAIGDGAQFDLIPINLRRGAFGTLNSVRRKGRDLSAPIDGYCKSFFETRKQLKNVHHVDIQYEYLARNPRRELARVMGEMGLVFEESQLQWRNAVIRDVGGNRMRQGSSDLIRLDESWRRELNWRLKLRILIQTLPVRLRSRLLFRLWRRWLKPVKDTPKLNP
ncbi:sulfotransferase protein family [Synechococcus sp. ROS8604]|nr:sulfotransferase protein family [Synechococcus sp. ROS8604]